MSEIYLSEIMNDLNPLKDYKIHFAKAASNEPLDVYMRSFDEWKQWNSWSNGRNDFNRKFIFSLINFYPEIDTWLFGGIWEVVNRDFENGGEYPYNIVLLNKYQNLIGRLKIKYAHRERSVRNLMENYFSNFIIKEILEEPYSVQIFPGYKNIDISFTNLEIIIKKDHQYWKNALSINGIYLITDRKTEKKYVGKASGNGGLWQRWSDYITDGHGGDVELKKLIDNNGGLLYARNYYKFTLLEIVESNLQNDIDDREKYWKKVLMTTNSKMGLNKN